MTSEHAPSDQWFQKRHCPYCNGGGGAWVWEGSWFSGGEIWRICGSCKGSGIRGMDPDHLASYLGLKGQKDG